MWRGLSTNFSINIAPFPKAAAASEDALSNDSFTFYQHQNGLNYRHSLNALTSNQLFSICLKSHILLNVSNFITLSLKCGLFYYQ